VDQQIVDSLKQVMEQLIIDHTKCGNHKPNNFTTPIKSSSSSPKLAESPLTTPPDSNDQHYYTKSFDQSYDNSYLNKKSKENNQWEPNSFGRQQEASTQSKSPFLRPEQLEKSPSPVTSANGFPMASISSPLVPSSTSTKIASTQPTKEKVDIEELQKQIDQMTTQIDHLQTENINLHINMNNLHQQLLLKEEFRVEVSHPKETDELKQQNKQLEHKLQRLNQGYEELKNEYTWYKSNNKDKLQDQESNDDKNIDQSQTQVADLTPDSGNYTRDTLVSKECMDCADHNKTIKSLKEELQNKDKEVNDLRREIGNKDDIIDEDKIPEKFVQKYHEYELNKLNDKTKVELVNIVKLIMLTLLISDVDNLGYNMTKYGTYLKLSIPFLDKLHEKLYDNNGRLKPSYYIRNKEGCDHDLLRLSKCLQGMLDTID
jgi:acyl transferase domain-containing protein